MPQGTLMERMEVEVGANRDLEPCCENYTHSAQVDLEERAAMAGRVDPGVQEAALLSQSREMKITY